jgi:hypothetical protein
MSLEGAERVVAAAERSGKVLAMCHPITGIPMACVVPVETAADRTAQDERDRRQGARALPGRPLD